MEKQRVEQLQWSESKHALLKPHLQPPQFENLHEQDSQSSKSGASDSGAVSFKYRLHLKIC